MCAGRSRRMRVCIEQSAMRMAASFDCAAQTAAQLSLSLVCQAPDRSLIVRRVAVAAFQTTLLLSGPAVSGRLLGRPHRQGRWLTGPARCAWGRQDAAGLCLVNEFWTRLVVFKFAAYSVRGLQLSVKVEPLGCLRGPHRTELSNQSAAPASMTGAARRMVGAAAPSRSVWWGQRLAPDLRRHR